MAKIAVLTSRFPFPLEKGDKLRIFNQVKGLSVGNEIHLIALDEKIITAEQREALEPFCKSIHVFQVSKMRQLMNISSALFENVPLQVGIYYSRAIHIKIKKLLAGLQPDAVYCHLIRMSEYVRDEKHLKKTIDYMDAFSIGMKRRAQISNILLKPVLHLEHKRLVQYERNIFDDFEQKVIISSQDREAIGHPDKNKIHIIPNGVDFNQFFPEEKEKKYDLLFTGNMGYPPNIESAHYAATKILPLIHRTHPQATLLIAGVDAPARIRKLRSDRIFVIEKFNHIRDAFAASKIMLAPMLISIGLQNKIIQAMAMKIPCIVSSLANNAIHAGHQKEIIEANSPADFAAAYAELIENDEKYNSIREKAFEFVRNNFDWKIQNEKLETIILS